MDRIVTIVSLTRVLVSCAVGVWLGCINVVPTTVQERATPDYNVRKTNRLNQAVVFFFVESFISRA